MECHKSSVLIMLRCMLWVSQGDASDNNTWDGDGMQLGHTWDCIGMGCDAATLKPWDEYRYIVSPDYAPQNPADHGGAIYGENIWLVGRASDAISKILAEGSEEETCCGWDSAGGCGQCLLIQSDDAVQKDWTAVVMKKSSCPVYMPGCEEEAKRFDLVVPGYEIKDREGSRNVCSARSGTLFTSENDSYTLGEWYKDYPRTNHVDNMARCETLPEDLRSGCKLFSSWGWTTSNPNVKYRKVKCPERFKEWVSTKFNADGVVREGWYGHDLRLTHFWDCNGMGCDSTVLQPSDKTRYYASPAYGPQDPERHGGAEYGEKMWLVGAASDTLTRFLGASDPCCGTDWTLGDNLGCGRCILIQNPDAVESNWSAIVMKKSRCPPESNGCEEGKVHLDLAVPGYDLLTESTANVCADRDKRTLFDEKEQSAILGDWYKRAKNTSAPQSIERCSWLDPALQDGCRLFSSWGWTVGNPKNVKFKRVECPARFVEWVSDAFGKDGPSHSRGMPTTTTTTTLPTTTSTTTTKDLSATSTSTTTSRTTTTTTRRSYLRQYESSPSNYSQTVAVSIITSCAGFFCFMSCMIACCSSKWRG